MARGKKNGREPRLIAGVLKGSVGEEVGLEKGDRLISVNGRVPDDIIDYCWEISDESIVFEIQKESGEIWHVDIEKEYGEPLGLSFDPPTMTPVHTCANRCIFCFIKQNPPGLRPSIYFRDDDYRLSFLEGHYITLTSLTDSDLDRIIKKRISPLFVSIHSTNPVLREKMMGNPRAGAIMEQLGKLVKGGIQVHGQIVLCPGWNDGDELERTLKDLASLGKGMQSVAVVPVGLTSFRHALATLSPVSGEKAGETIDRVVSFQEIMLRQRGTRFVYLADEFYLAAGRPLPAHEDYEGYPQLSNGVGLLRLLAEEYREWKSDLNSLKPGGYVRGTLVTGEAAAGVMHKVVSRLKKIQNLDISLKVVPNRFFGSGVTVAGLLTGSDLLDSLKGTDPGGLVIYPGVMLGEGKGLFLDNLAPGEVASILNVELKPAGSLYEIGKAIKEYALAQVKRG